jgi:hypothetical protein
MPPRKGPLKEAVVPTIGTVPPQPSPTQQADQQLLASIANHNRGAFALAGQGYAENPLWDNKSEIQSMRLMGFDARVRADEIQRMLSFVTGSLPAGNQAINDRFAKRHTVADLNIPRNPEAMIALSMKYSFENATVSKGAKVKTDFICSQFHHKTHNTAAKDFYDDYVIELRIKTQLRKIVYNLVTVGLCPIYWGGEDGGPIDLFQVVDPLACRYVDILGRQKLYLKITQTMIDAVKDPKGEKSAPNKAQYEAMPQYWIDQIQKAIDGMKPQALIELQEGSYTVLENRYASTNRQANTLDGVPLQGAFDALQRYRLFAAGDFAVAWNVKNMLILVSEGDPKALPQDYIPADNQRLANLEAAFSNPNNALMVFCDANTTVRYVIPPLEAFKTDKYTQCEKEIKEVLNLPSFMWANDGHSTFGAATAEVVLLKKECEAIRMLLEEQLFRPFYERLRTGAKRPGFSKKEIPLPTFDEMSLQDTVTFLQHCGEMYARGALSLESYMEVSGFDFAWEMEQKKIEHEKYGNTSEDAVVMNNTVARPLYESGQGNTQPDRDKGGNSGDGTGNPADTNRTPRTPRTRGK